MTRHIEASWMPRNILAETKVAATETIVPSAPNIPIPEAVDPPVNPDSLPTVSVTVPGVSVSLNLKGLF